MFNRLLFPALALCAAFVLPTVTPFAPSAFAEEAKSDRPLYVDFDNRKSTHEAGIIKMTIFLDFYCSHCHQFDITIVPQLEKEYGDKLQVEYIGYPLVDPQVSHIPVLAYYLADEQGKGKAMRDALFTTIWDLRMDVSRPDILLGVAAKAGLDLDAFKQGFNSNSMMERMERGMEAAKAIKLRGTPTVLIDNHLKMNDISMRGLEAVFAEVLAADG
jgi:thiol:disulfide interchange protein DsbA